MSATKSSRVPWFVFFSILALPCAASAQVGAPPQVQQAFGSFHERIDVLVPAYRGLEPKVALTYSSHSGNGFVGVGWTLEATSIIQRGNGKGGAPAYDASDSFFLDGQELIPDRSLGGTHSTKYQNYQRIVWNTTDNHWRVYAKDGTVLTYAPYWNTPKGTFRWYLAQAEDTRRNTVNYEYGSDPNNEVYLQRIRYNGSEIVFHREARPDPVQYGIGEGVATMHSRLKTIDVRVGTSRARTYSLHYGTSGDTRRSVLTTVRRWGRDAAVSSDGTVTGGSSMPPITIATQATSGVGTFSLRGAPDSWGWGDQGFLSAGDVNRDGKADVMYALPNAQGQVMLHTALGAGDGNFSYHGQQTTWGWSADQRWMTGDVNADGRVDFMIVHNAGGTARLHAAISRGDGQYTLHGQNSFGFHEGQKWATGDVDGDGRADFMMVTPIGGFVRFHAALSNGDGTYRFTSFDSGLAWADNTKLLVGDYDGDGRSDFLLLYNWGGPIRCHVAFSLGDGRFRISGQDFPWGMAGDDHQRWFVGDVNGDGRTDLMMVYNASGRARLHTGISYGNGQFALGGHDTTWAYHPSQQWLAGDANGDGRSDFMLLHPGGSGVVLHTALTTGPNTYRLTGQSSGWTWSDASQWIPADINGSGRTDLLFVYRPYVMESVPRQTAATLSGSVRAVNEIREIVGSQGRLRFRVGSETDASDRWHEIAFPDATLTGHLAFAGSAVAVSGSRAIPSNGRGVVHEIRGENGRLGLRLNTDYRNGTYETHWVYLTAPGVTFRGSRSFESGGLGRTLRAIEARDNHLIFHVNGLAANDPVVQFAVGVSGARISGSTGELPHSSSGDRGVGFRTIGSSVEFFTAQGNGGRIYFHPPGERRLIRFVGRGGLLDVVTGALAGNDRLTHTFGVSGATLVGSTADSGGNGVVALEGGVGYLAVTYGGWAHWDYVRAEKTVYDQVRRNQPMRFHSAIDGDAVVPDLLTHIKGELGSTTSVKYLASTAAVNEDLPAGLVFPIVEEMWVRDGRNVEQMFRYGYEGARWDRAEQRLLGFRRVTVNIGVDGTWQETYLRQSAVSLPGKPDATTIYHPNGRKYRQEHYTYAEKTSPPYTSVVSHRYDQEYNLETQRMRQRLREYGYDAYGNVTLEREHGDTSLSGDEHVTYTAHVYNTEKYIVGLPSYVDVHRGLNAASNMSSRIKLTYYAYDGATTHLGAPSAGLLTRVTEWNSQGNDHGYAATQFEYDAPGNLVRQVDPLGHATRFAYDGTYRVFLTSVTNALGHVERTQWDAVLGLPTKKIDSNGNEENFAYDVYGHLRLREVPGFGSETFSLLDWGDPTRQRIRKVSTDGTSDGLFEETHLDGLGRTHRVVKEGGRIQQWVYYDNSDRAIRESLPRYDGQTTLWRRYEYDGAGRLIRTIEPDDRTTVIDYFVGWARHTDPRGVVKEVHKNVFDQTTAIVEWNGTNRLQTDFSYDELGRRTRTRRSTGEVASLEYDSLGRVLANVDENSGRTRFDYDRAGRVTRRTDAKNQSVTYSYDALGRLTSNSAGVTLRYDETFATNGRGRLTTAVFGIGKREVTGYSAMGAVTSETVTLDGVARSFAYAHDFLGRATSVTYPDGEVVRYAYDASGRLASIPNYVSSVAYSAFDQPTSIQYANGVTTTQAYDAARQLPSSVQVKRGTTSLYDLRYSYDAKNRIVRTQSTTRPAYQATYGYDDLDRLLSIAGGQSQTFTYNAVGNMLSNSAVGSYSYGDATHKHAVTAAGAMRFVYDANGNMTSGAGRTIAWDVENRPTRIEQNGSSFTFAYDAAGQRVRRTGPSGTTHVYNRYLEREGSTGTKSIWMGDVLVATKTGGTTLYHHRDHLGTVHTITNASGQVVREADFEPYGRVRRQTGTARSDRGFTNHRHDMDTGLIYMNARYYDPVLGRFLSADPVVPIEADNPQALNRYSYAENNPISKSDPTGLFAWSFGLFDALRTATSFGITKSSGIDAALRSTKTSSSFGLSVFGSSLRASSPGIGGDVKFSIAKTSFRNAALSIPGDNRPQLLDQLKGTRSDDTAGVPPALYAVRDAVNSVFRQFGLPEGTLGLFSSNRWGVENFSVGRTQRWQDLGNAGTFVPTGSSYSGAFKFARFGVSRRGPLSGFSVGAGADLAQLGPLKLGGVAEIGRVGKGWDGVPRYFLRLNISVSAEVARFLGLGGLTNKISGSGGISIQTSCSGPQCLSMMERFVETLGTPGSR